MGVRELDVAVVRERLRVAVVRVGGRAKWCRLCGLDRSHVYEFLDGRRKSPGTKALAAIGVRKSFVEDIDE